MAKRGRPTRQQVSRTNIFWPHGEVPDLVAGEHNIRHLLPSEPPARKHLIRVAYAQRGLHIPVPPVGSKTRIGLLVNIPSDPSVDVEGDIQGQLAYINGMQGRGVPAIELLHARDLVATKRKLVVPYVNSPDEEAYLHSLGAEIFGPPAQLFAQLNDKVKFHDWAVAYTREVNPEFAVIKHKNVTTGAIAADGPLFMQEIIEDYDKASLLNDYIKKDGLGVVLRGGDSEGGFGIAKIRYRHKKRQWTVDTAPDKTFTRYADAFAKAQQFFESMNGGDDYPVVMNRFMDVEDSPAESMLIADGHVFSLGWNGQMQEGEDTSCIGTIPYTPQTEQSRKVYTALHERTAPDYAAFIAWVAAKIGIKFNDLRMIVNQDMMMPSELELVFQKRKHEPLHIPRAELNFRLSERTDAIVGAAVLGGVQQTPAGFTEVAGKLTTYLKYPFPKGVDPRVIRDALGEAYQGKDVTEGTVFVRVASTPNPKDKNDDPRLGLAIYGDPAQHIPMIDSIIEHTTQKVS